MEKVDRLDLLPAFGDRERFYNRLRGIAPMFFAKPHHGCPENRQTQHHPQGAGKSPRLLDVFLKTLSAAQSLSGILSVSVKADGCADRTAQLSFSLMQISQF